MEVSVLFKAQWGILRQVLVCMELVRNGAVGDSGGVNRSPVMPSPGIKSCVLLANLILPSKFK